MTFIEHSTQQQRNTHSFQGCNEKSPRPGHKTNLELKRIEIIQTIFTDHNKLENNKIQGKFPNYLEIKEEISREIKKYLELNE